MARLTLTDEFLSLTLLGMEVAVWLHAETLINRRVFFTHTSSRISGMEVAFSAGARIIRFMMLGATIRAGAQPPSDICYCNLNVFLSLFFTAAGLHAQQGG